jgi:ACS family hexuronate transporter-like MFS transporter
MDSSSQARSIEPATESGKARFTLPGMRWWVAGLLMCITVINYIDRSALGVAAPSMMKDLNIDVAYYGLWVVGAFQVVYGVSQFFAGRVIDWLNIRVGYSVALGVWSLAQVLTGLASGGRSLAVFRGMLGMGEAGNFPGAIKTVSQWFPPKERTIATGILNIGSGLGSFLAPFLVVWIILNYHWRAAFVVTGLIGFAWIVVWLIAYRSPDKHPWVSKKELDYIRSGEALLKVADPPKEKGTYKLVLPQKNFWALALARFLSEPAWQFFTYFIPIYLTSVRGFSMKQVAWSAAVPFIAADLGCLFGGFLSPYFIKKGVAVIRARKLAVTIPAVMMIAAVFIGVVQSAELAVVFFSIGAFSHQAISSTLLTLPADLFPKRTVATANGMSGTFGYLGGFLFTASVGFVAKAIGYTPLFVAMGLFDIIGAIILWSLLREPKSDDTPVKVTA